MARILFGIVAPLLVLFVVWVFGSPPATSMFWADHQATVTGHEVRTVATGYGDTEKTFPLLSLSGTTEASYLNLPEVEAEAEVIAEWPVGRTFATKLSPSGGISYASDDPRRDYLLAWIVLVIVLAIVLMTVKSYFGATDAISLMLGGIGAAFVVVPAVLLFGLWTIGDPPAVSVFWPSKAATVVSTMVETYPVGNGTTARRPIVMVTPEGETENVRVSALRPGLFESRSAEEIAAEFPVGGAVELKQAPDGGLFEPRWRFENWLALFISIVAPLMIFIGQAMFRAGFFAKKTA